MKSCDEIDWEMVLQGMPLHKLLVEYRQQGKLEKLYTAAYRHILYNPQTGPVIKVRLGAEGLALLEAFVEKDVKQNELRRCIAGGNRMAREAFGEEATPRERQMCRLLVEACVREQGHRVARKITEMES